MRSKIFYSFKLFIICIYSLMVFTSIGCDNNNNSAKTNKEIAEVIIIMPEEGDVYREGETIQFKGSAFNSEGNMLSEDSLIWTSNIDGLLNTGSEFETNRLSFGKHRICLNALDADNEESEDCFSINIQQPLLSQVSAGFNHALFVGTDGGIWAWGVNEAGQLGDGTTESQSTPVRVGIDSPWIKAVAGGKFSVGLKSDGTLWVWGYDFMNFGPDQLNPTLLSESEDWVDVDAGHYRITAINSDGQCYIWEGGYPYIDPFEGIIGDEPNSYWKVSATGYRHILLIKTDGTLWCRSKSVSIDGYDRFYNLNNWNWFKQIGEEADWVQADAYENQGIALKVDGSLYALFFEEDDVTMNQIGNDIDWEIPSVGLDHCAAIKADSSLWTCDDYKQGQVSSVLQQYENEYDWIAVSSGKDFTVALKTSGIPVFIGDLPVF